MTRKKPGTPAPSSDSRVVPRLIVAAVLTVIALVFIVQNNQWVAIRLLVPLVTMPLWVALTGMLVAGAAIGYAVSWRRR